MKKTALFIAIVMLVSFVMPAFAAEDDMADVLKTVKERIEIPAECTEFGSYTSVYDDARHYSFSWSTPQNQKGVHVAVNDKKIITNYYTYGYNGTEEERPYYKNKTIPQISKEEALSQAQEFFAKIDPQIYPLYDFNDAEIDFYAVSYQIFAYRKENGIKTNDGVYISVNAASGNITSISVDYTFVESFPSTDKAIGAEKAEQIFRGNALKKIYYDFHDGEMAQIVWMPTDFTQIDAFSGERFDLMGNYRYDNAAKELASSKGSDDEYVEYFTEQELAELNTVAGLMSINEAEEKIRSMSELDMEGTKTERTSISRRGERYVMELSFDAEDRGGYALLDAKTGQLLSFWGYNENDDGEWEYDDEFVQKYYSDYLSRTKVVDNSYRVRVENGIEYPFNSITCDRDKVSGKVKNFSLNFDEAEEFEMPEGIAEEAAVYDVLFDKISPELFYTFLYDEKEARLIYTIDFSNIHFIDAQTLKLLGYDGKEQRASIPSGGYNYTDISGHFAEDAIKALASIDVGFADTEFKPDSIITQKEYTALLSQCVYDYVFYSKSGAVDLDETSKYFVRVMGVSEDEFESDKPLTREKALKLLLDSGMSQFSYTAKIKGIFKTDFADESDIDEELLGYVAIAKGLHIINGSTDGYFYPKTNITRGEAAVMIYNYLK